MLSHNTESSQMFDLLRNGYHLHRPINKSDVLSSLSVATTHNSSKQKDVKTNKIFSLIYLNLLKFKFNIMFGSNRRGKDSLSFS